LERVKVVLRTRACAATAVVLVLLCAWNPYMLARQQDMQDMPGMDMQHEHEEESPRLKAKLAADKRESEFNHHIAGFLLILAGAFLFAQGKLGKRWPLTRYVWPACFLAAGIYLLVFSDTEIWPFGHKALWVALRDDPEDLQHKVFSLILLAIGFIELQRTRGKLRNAWSPWVFPLAGMLGAIMLLFHHHQAGMHGPNHMALMQHIQKEHRGFAITGGGIALTKGLSEIQWSWRETFHKIWPLLLIVLGVLLMLYTE
jgi:copper resistance protein D